MQKWSSATWSGRGAPRSFPRPIGSLRKPVLKSMPSVPPCVPSRTTESVPPSPAQELGTGRINYSGRDMTKSSMIPRVRMLVLSGASPCCGVSGSMKLLSGMGHVSLPSRAAKDSHRRASGMLYISVHLYFEFCADRYRLCSCSWHNILSLLFFYFITVHALHVPVTHITSVGTCYPPLFHAIYKYRCRTTQKKI